MVTKDGGILRCLIVAQCPLDQPVSCIIILQHVVGAVTEHSLQDALQTRRVGAKSCLQGDRLTLNSGLSNWLAWYDVPDKHKVEVSWCHIPIPWEELNERVVKHCIIPTVAD